MPRITSGVRPLAAAVALGLMLCLPAPLSAMDRAWIEVKSPHFTAISDAGDKPAREVLWAFEQMRMVIHGLFPWAGVEVNRPIMLLLVHNGSAMRQLLPDLDERKQTFTPPSMSAYGSDRYYIALRTDRVSDQQTYLKALAR